jgi:hypothetical protein
MAIRGHFPRTATIGCETLAFARRIWREMLSEHCVWLLAAARKNPGKAGVS